MYAHNFPLQASCEWFLWVNFWSMVWEAFVIAALYAVLLLWFWHYAKFGVIIYLLKIDNILFLKLCMVCQHLEIEIIKGEYDKWLMQYCGISSGLKIELPQLCINSIFNKYSHNSNLCFSPYYILLWYECAYLKKCAYLKAIIPQNWRENVSA